MAKIEKNPSQAGISAASVQGQITSDETEKKNKKTSGNQQYKK